MPNPLSASLIRSLNTLPHHALVIDRSGTVLFASDSLKNNGGCLGLTAADWFGQNYLELLSPYAPDHRQLQRLHSAIGKIIRDERPIASTQLTLQTTGNSNRLLRMDAFVLITEPSEYAAERAIVITLDDLGPTREAGHLTTLSGSIRLSRRSHSTLLPVCASCKSIRNSREEWNTMERYMQQELAVQFTHDICPECIRRLYPKYAGAFTKIPL